MPFFGNELNRETLGLPCSLQWLDALFGLVGLVREDIYLPHCYFARSFHWSSRSGVLAVCDAAARRRWWPFKSQGLCRGALAVVSLEKCASSTVFF